MIHIDTYKLFESSSYDVISNVNDILLELVDDGFTCKVDRGNSIKDVIENSSPKIPFGFTVVKTHDIINIHINKSVRYTRMEFRLGDIIEVYYRFKEYLESNGYIEDEFIINSYKFTPTNKKLLTVCSYCSIRFYKLLNT